MVRTATEERIRQRLEQIQRQEEQLRNKLLLLRNAGKPAHDMPGFEAAREASAIFVRDNKIPWVNYITSLVKLELGDEYVVKITKPRGPRIYREEEAALRPKGRAAKKAA